METGAWTEVVGGLGTAPAACGVDPVLGPHQCPGIMYAVQSGSANQMTALGTSCDDYGGCSEASLQEGREGQGRRAIPQTGADSWGFPGRRDRKSVWATRVQGVSSSTCR